MTKRLTDIPEEKMEAYRATARRRRQEREGQLAERRERAWEVAHEAAELLRAQYGATKVVLFGSLAREGPFDEHSDVDLVAWSTGEREYYRVVSRLLDIEPTIQVDFIRAEEAPDSLLEVVESEGVAL